MNNPGVQQPVKLRADVVGNAWNRLLAAAKDLGAFKTVFAVLASSAGAYVVGGIVLALRLSQARFPVQASLDVIPPSVLLVAGVRDLLLSAIIALLLCGLMLAATVWLPDWCAFLVPGLLLLIVPLNLGGLAWPVGLCVLGVLFWRSKARMERDRTWVPPVGLIASVCAVVVLGLTLARYTVPPYKYPVGELQVRNPDKPNARFTAAGGYIGAANDFVYIAGSDRTDEPGDSSFLAAYARDQVLYMRISPPPEGTERPRTSILGSIIRPRLALTPVGDIWWRDRYEGIRLFR